MSKNINYDSMNFVSQNMLVEEEEKYGGNNGDDDDDDNNEESPETGRLQLFESNSDTSSVDKNDDTEKYMQMKDELFQYLPILQNNTVWNQDELLSEEDKNDNEYEVEVMGSTFNN